MMHTGLLAGSQRTVGVITRSTSPRAKLSSVQHLRLRGQVSSLKQLASKSGSETVAAPASLAVLLQLSAPAAQAAEEATSGGNIFTDYFSQLSNLSPAGVALLSSPLLLYGVFRVYQSNVNPNAKWGDFVFLGAFLLIMANIVSIAAYKTRLF